LKEDPLSAGYQIVYAYERNDIVNNTLGFSIENIDSTADPAQDFYRFAAGRWLDQAVIPETEGQASGFIGLFRQVNEQILTLLQNAAAQSQKAPKGSVVQQVGDFFAAAMDTQRLDELGITPLQPDFERLDAMTTATDLAVTVAHLLATSGSPVLLVPYVMADKKQSDRNVLGIYPGGLTINNRDVYVAEAYAPVRAALVAHIARMMQLAGASGDLAAQQAQMILDLETALATAKLSPVEASDPEATYYKMTVAELHGLAPHFDFATFFAQLKISTAQDVIVAEPRYMQALDALLVERPIEDLRIYLRWRLLNSISQYLAPAVAEADLDFFEKQLQGKTELLPRPQRVAAQMQKSLGHPVAQLYVKEYFSAQTRAQVTELVDRIKTQFDIRLRLNPWLDDPTRTFALDKLDKMVIRVGYPEKWIDFSNVEIRRDDYLGNAARLNQFDLGHNLAKAGAPVVADEFAFPGATLPTDINAAYQPAANKIEISAAILQPPFFYPQLDLAVNYGTLGAVIAHEMTHGFDSIGRCYDAAGNLIDWWTANDSEEFEAFTTKLVDQYGKYEALPGVFVNGKLTVTENTADLGGVTLAYHALQGALAEQSANDPIDGYSPEPRFFIAWAQLWMSKERPEVLKLMISSDPHPPSGFRATGPLVNLDAFFATFAIQPGDAMWRNKEDRVEIW
jgi:putative endopeptidase